MPYALIPEDYTLKRVTKAQEAAVNSKRSHENVIAFLENENTPLVVGGAIATILTGIFVKQIAEDFNLDEDKVKETVKKTAFSAGGLSGVLLKKLTELDLDISKLDVLSPKGLS